MKSRRTNLMGPIGGFVWMGLGLGAFFWVIEAAAHAVVLHEGAFFQHLHSPEPHEIWMRLIVVVLFCGFGICVQFMITRVKQSEEATRLSRAELDQVFNAAADGMRVIDRDFNLLRSNETFSRLSGMSNEEAVGKKCYDVFRGPLCHTPNCPLSRILGGEDRVECDVEKDRHDGNTVPCILTATPFRAPSGELNGIVENFKDITDRKQAEEALRQSEQRFRSLVETTSDWVWEVDQNGIYTYASPKVKDLLGYEPVEVIGKTPFDFMPMDEAKRVARLFGDTIESRKVFAQLKNTNLHKDGRRVVLETSAVPIFDQAGDLLCYRGIDRDITGRERAEEEKERLGVQLRQAQKMEAIGTLAGGIAHDFNNILTPMIIHTEIALSDIDEESPVRDNLLRVSQAAYRAKEMVRLILTFSRQASAKPLPMKVAPVVREVLKLLRASLPTTIEIRQDIKSTSYLTMADPTQIHQVLINLCTNAEHAMREKGGMLEVSLADMEIGAKDAVKYPDMKPGPYLRLTVSDTGTGMDRTVIDRIFDPFFTTKQSGEGTGMGLAVVHGIVKSCGGAITVYSEPEKGTTFHVFFPRTETEAPQQILPAGPLPTGNERILFVDDNEVVVDAVRLLLESLGYKVVARMNGIEALEVFKAQPNEFDLVITDQTMPHMPGKELAQELIRIRPDIPIILCTGYSERITEEEAKAVGIREYVMKPFAMDDMARIIRKVLDE